MLGSQQLIPGLLPAWSALSRHISTHIARIYQTNSETISHHIPSYPIISHLTSKSDVWYCFMMFLFSPSLHSMQFKHIQNHTIHIVVEPTNLKGVRLIAWGHAEVMLRSMDCLKTKSSCTWINCDYLDFILAQVFKLRFHSSLILVTKFW